MRLLAILLALLAGCAGVSAPATDLPAYDAPADPSADVLEPTDATPESPATLSFTVVQFNTGTSGTFDPDAGPGGFTQAMADLEDQYYGNGLAWRKGIDDARAFLALVDPDIVAFQEIFWAGDCPDVPAEARVGFVCEAWKAGDPTVAQLVAGAGFQVACNWGKPDKCAAVNRRFGTFRGCDGDFCLEGLFGSTVTGCGKGARVGRGVIDLVAGGELTLVNVHGSSGIAAGDQDCRVLQFRQIFEDLGDGKPAASGARNVILGDFNTDPGRLVEADPSAAYLADRTGPGAAFHFLTAVGPDVLPTYAGFFNIDHVLSDVATGACWTAGVTDGHPPASASGCFDHHPEVCAVTIESSLRQHP